MAEKQTFKGMLFLAASMLVGGLASTTLVNMLFEVETGSGSLPLILGAVFAAAGWVMAENIGEAIVFLLITAILGTVALVFLRSDLLRIVVITFLCGFNTGKLAVGVYREIQ